MLNIAHCWRNANQNYNDISPHNGQNGLIKKSTAINAGEGVEKRKRSCTAGENVN